MIWGEQVVPPLGEICWPIAVDFKGLELWRFLPLFPETLPSADTFHCLGLTEEVVATWWWACTGSPALVLLLPYLHRVIFVIVYSL